MLIADHADHVGSEARGPSHENLAVDSEKLRQLYTTMLELRFREHEHARRFRKRAGRLQFSEACEAGCTIDLRPEDIVAPLPQQRVAALKTFRILSSSSRLRLSLAAGAAFAHQADKNGAVVVAFFRAIEISEGKEVLFFALDHHLPIVFVQVDAAQPRKKPRGNYSGPDPNFPAIPVDRSDVVAVYRVAYEALARARRESGPTLIQCVEYHSTQNGKQDQHCTDPIAYLERYLRNKNLWSPDICERTADGELLQSV